MSAARHLPPLPVQRCGVGRRAVLAGLLAAVAAPLSAAGAQEPRFFRIGTAATTGTYFQIGGIIASALSNPPGSPECQRGNNCGVPGLVAVAQATQGSVENVQGIASGQFEAAFVQADVAHWAWRGQGPYATKGAVKGLRAIAGLFPEHIHIVVAQDGPVKSLGDLAGRRVSLGERESGTLTDSRLILGAAGLAERGLTAEYLRLAQAAAALGEGKIDAFFLVAGYPVPAITELAVATPIRLLAIPDEIAAKLEREHRFLMRSSIPGDAYEGLPGGTPTLAIRALLVTAADVPEPLVYAVTKTLWSDRTRGLLEGRHPLAQRIRLESALDGVAVPLHPGAERFYREAGIAIGTPSAD